LEKLGFGVEYQREQTKPDVMPAPPPTMGDLMWTRDGHVWLFIMKFEDGSVLGLHDSPPCCSFFGTPTPDGYVDSMARRTTRAALETFYPEVVRIFGNWQNRTTWPKTSAAYFEERPKSLPLARICDRPASYLYHNQFRVAADLLSPSSYPEFFPEGAGLRLLFDILRSKNVFVERPLSAP
jgi:hypothetical protein